MLNLKKTTSLNYRILQAYTYTLGFMSIITLSSELKSVLSSREENIFSESESKKMFAKDTSVWLKSAHERDYHIDMSSSLNDVMAHFLSKVSEIDQIYLLRESEKTFHVWSVLPEKTNAIKRNIYKSERELIDFFREDFYFDFHINILSDIENIKSSGAFLIFQKK
jgi:hypothetical protein